MKVYRLDGEYAATVDIAPDQVVVTGPFEEDVTEIINTSREVTSEVLESEEGLGDNMLWLEGGSLENAEEFLQNPGRWGYKV